MPLIFPLVDQHERNCAKKYNSWCVRDKICATSVRRTKATQVKPCFMLTFDLWDVSFINYIKRQLCKPL